MYDYKAEGALPESAEIKRVFALTDEKLRQYKRV